MAYDPKDPADKKIVDDLIAAALAEQAEEHGAEIEGLKAKKTELLGKIAKLKADKGGADGPDTDKLEAEVERLSGELKTATKALDKATKDLTTVTGERDGLGKQIHNLVADQGLTTALVEAKVPTQLLPAVKALLLPKVAIKTEGDDRKAVVGDKALGDFVKEWSQGDEGKHYVAARVNGGGGGPGNPQGGSPPTGKVMDRAAFDALDPMAANAFMAEGGTLTDAS
jgi:hypothetical protein